MSALVPGRVVERYEVVKALGEGGAGSVYLVRHLSLGGFRALKVLHSRDAEIRRRFLLEGRTQSMLQHQNIVQVFDVLDVDGEPGLLIEYIEGSSLDNVLPKGGYPPAEAEALFRGVVAGVAAAHAAGMVHRDLKPANILLARGPDGVVMPKVADFGLAKVLGEGAQASQTRTGVAFGTPSYMSPEQINDTRGCDHRSDIFALGCILYELLAGRLAFTAPTTWEILTAVMGERYPSLREVRPGLPEPLYLAVESCLRHDREDRPVDCAALLRILDGDVPRARGTAAPAAGSITLPPFGPASPPAPSATVRPAGGTLSQIQGKKPVVAGVAVLGVGMMAGLAALIVVAGLAWYFTQQPAPKPTPTAPVKPFAIEMPLSI